MVKMFEYDFYVPTIDNEGRKYPKKLLSEFKKQLISEFGGLTDFRQRNVGIWRTGGVEFRDEVILLRVISENFTPSRKFIKKFKKGMEKSLNQKKVLIVEHAVKCF